MTDKPNETAQQQNNKTTKEQKADKPKKTETPEKPKASEESKATEKSASSVDSAASVIQERESQKAQKKVENTEVSEKKVKVSAKLAKIITEIEKLTVLELSDLVKALEDKFGVSGVPIAAAPAQPQVKSNQASQFSSEQTIFNVILAQTGPNKIQVIKALRKIKPTLGLQETKKITESTPEEILHEVNKKEAEEAKKKLEESGATVELK